MYGKVEICGVSTSELPKLSKEETDEMLKKISAGDNEAKAHFIRANLRLVLSVTQKFAQRTDNMDDIFQIGCIGLIKSIDNFDFSYNVRFSTYAVPMNNRKGKNRGGALILIIDFFKPCNNALIILFVFYVSS